MVIIGKPRHSKPSNILKFLCILTFIWSGLGILYNLTYSLFLNYIKNIMTQIELPEIYNNYRDLMLNLLSSGRFFFVLGLLANISSVYGAALMLRMQKKGFHFYAIAQIVMLILPLIFVKGSSFSGGEFIITLTFITLYALNTKNMQNS